MQVTKLEFTALDLDPTLCGGSSCDYVRVYSSDYDVKISDTGHVVYSPWSNINVEFSSDGSGNGAGFIASVSYLGQSEIIAEIDTIYTSFIPYM